MYNVSLPNDRDLALSQVIFEVLAVSLSNDGGSVMNQFFILSGLCCGKLIGNMHCRWCVRIIQQHNYTIGTEMTLYTKVI